MAKKPSKKAAKKPAAKKTAPKKTAPKKAPAKKAAKPARASKSSARATKPTRATKPLRNPPLPGLEHVRYRQLDELCEEIGDCLDRINSATTDKKAALQSTKAPMIKHGITIYKHAGVQITCTPGDYSVSCKRIKDGEGEGADIGASQRAPEIDPEAGDPLDESGGGGDDTGDGWGDEPRERDDEE